MSGQFRVEMAFALTGRGVVLAGTILEGTVRNGMSLTVPGADPFRIGSVEVLDVRSQDRALTALLSDDKRPIEVLQTSFVGMTAEFG